MSILNEEKYIEDGFIETSYFGNLLEGQGFFTYYFADNVDYYDEQYYENRAGNFVLFADLTEAIQQGAADLTSSFAFAVTVDNLVFGTSAVISTSSVSAVATRLAGVAAAVNSEFATTITSRRLAGVAAAVNSEFAVVTLGAAVRSASVSITGAFSPQITVRAIRGLETDLILETTMVSAVNITASAESLLEYFADLSAQYNLIRESPVTVTAEFSVGHVDEELGLQADILPAVDFIGAADLVNTATVLVAGNLIADSEAVLSAEFAATVDAQRIRDNSSDLDCITDFTTDAGTIKQAAADLDAFYSQLTAAGRVSDFFINCEVVATVSASSAVVFSGDGAVIAESDITAAGDRTRSTTGAVGAVFSSAVEADRIRTSAAGVGGVFTVTSAGNLIKTIVSAISMNTAFAVELTRIRLFTVDLNTEFDLLISTGRIQRITANLEGVFGFEFAGQVLRQPRVVYIVPRENRRFSIQNEIRIANVDNETRIYSIQGDS